MTETTTASSAPDIQTETSTKTPEIIIVKKAPTPSTEARMILTCLTDFSSLVSPNPLSQATQKRMGQLIARSVIQMLRYPTTENFNTFFTFFKANYDGSMSERNAFIGINTIPKQDQSIVMVVWSAMVWKMKIDAIPLNMSMVLQTTKSPEFVAFLTSK